MKVASSMDRSRRAGLASLLVVVALVSALVGLGASPAHALSGTVLKGSTKCVGSLVRRCVYLQAYWVDGRRKVRAVARIRAADYCSWEIGHVSLYRNSTRVTTNYYEHDRGESNSLLWTRGTVRSGQYHALAEFYWNCDYTGNVSHGWLESGSRYFHAS